MAHLNSKRLPERDEEQPGSAAFEVYKPFDPEALDDELAQEMGWRKVSGLGIDGDPATASEEHPVTVWVLRGDDVETSAFKRTLTAHEVPDPDTALDDLVAKAEAGEDFTPVEIQEVLRRLLLRARP